MVLTCLPAVSSHSVDGWEGIWANDGRGSGWAIDVVQNSLADVFGGDWILWVLAIFMFVFAFSSLIAYYSMSEANLRFIKDDNKMVTVLRVFIVVIVFIACVIPVGMVWDICDVFMAIMGILNIIALFCLYKYVVALYKDYRKQKAAGVEVPVFNVDNWDSEGLDTSGITVWSGHSHGDE
jgi:AGCS family alanine or glycine:cation symporter/putative sodium/glutamine symporter